MSAAELPRYCKRSQRGTPQILITHTRAVLADHIEWTGHRQCRYRQATGKRLQQYQPKCLGSARQYEHIRRGVVSDQCLAILLAGKANLRIAAPQSSQ